MARFYTNELPIEDKPGSLAGATQSHERLCWCSWPCSACRGGLTPIGHLLGSSGAGPAFREHSPEELARVQITLLQQWAGKCHHNGPFEVVLPKLAEGSEHLVYLDASRARVFKTTRPRIFGESYYLVNGIMHQRNCSPLDYLLRLRLWKKLFQSAPRDLGITEAGQIVSTHEFISGTLPTQEQVDSFLWQSGLTDVKRNRWLWKRAYPEFEIWLGDARADNFVNTNVGIVPIDIRLWLSDFAS